MAVTPDDDRHPGDEPSFPLRVGSEAGERALGWMLCGGVVALAVLSFAPLAVTRFHTWPWILYWHVLLALPPIVFVLGAGARRPVPRLGAALDLGLALWAVSALLGAWFSPFRDASMSAALLPLSSVCLAYVLRGWMGFHPGLSRARASAAFLVLGWLAGAFVVVSWTYWLIWDVLPAQAAGATWADVWRLHNTHPLGHASYTAGLVVLFLPVLITQAVTQAGWARTGWLILALLALALVFSTNSRGGLLGMLVLLIAAGALAASTASLQVRTRVLLFGGGLVVAALVVMFSPRLRDVLARSEWSPVAEQTSRLRTSLAAAGWAMGKDRPLVGWGPGTVSLVYPRYRAQVDGGAENVLQLHSTPVQVWAEQGLPGVAAVLALALGVVMRTWRLRTGGVAAHAGTRADRTRAWAIVFGLLAYSVFAFTDHQVDVPLFAGVLAAMLAILSALTRPERAPDITWSPTFVRVVPALLVALALAVIGWFVWRDLRARQIFAAGRESLEHGDAATFTARVQQARQLDRNEPFYVNQQAFVLLQEMDAATDPAAIGALRERGIAALRESLAISPGQGVCEINLGWLLLDAARPREAEEHFRAVARLVPDKRSVYFGLGLALLLQQRESEAVRAMALEWLNDPRAIAHPVWAEADWQARRAAVARDAQVLLGDLVAQGVRVDVASTATYVHALITWWCDPTTDHAARAEVLGQVRDEDVGAFFRAVRTNEPPAEGTQPWQIVHRAWAGAEPEVTLAELPAPWAPWRDALHARILRERESFAEFLTGGQADADKLVRRTRPHRLAYGMHARNSDGIPIVDRTPREENVLTELLPAATFPPKGWIPSRVLVRWLEEPPVALPGANQLQ